MKKVYAVLLAAMMILAVAVPNLKGASDSAPGGFQGFLSGCCFGLRVGADYNDSGTGDRSFLSWFLVGICLGPRTAMDYRDGKDFHWRDIGRAVPYVNFIFAIWDGVDISGGKGRGELQAAYGAVYY